MNNTLIDLNPGLSQFDTELPLKLQQPCSMCSPTNDSVLLNSQIQSILDSTQSIFVEFGLDFKFTYCNSYSLDLFKYTPDDVINGLYILDILHESEKERFHQVITKILCNDYGNILEWQLLSRDGNILTISAKAIPLYANGSIYKIRAIGNDLTQLRYAEKQFKDSEKRFSNSFSHSPIGMAIFNSNGTIFKMNNYFKKYFSENILKNNLTQLIQSYFPFDQDIKNKLNIGQVVKFESMHETIDMSNRYLEWYLSMISDEQDMIKTYLAQVIDITHLKILEQKNIRKVQSVSQIADGLRNQITKNITFKDVVSKNSSVSKIINKLPRIAVSDASVLIVGESGSGKEVIARLIHNIGKRKAGPFISVNCGCIPENLIESELFGHKAGAFTDAKSTKKGKFLLAQGGTLFLDEIGDMPYSMQVKLLRALENKTIFPLGSENEVSLDIRIIAATHQPLKKLVAEHKFRQDLYFRLNVVKVELPPLRERPEDILPFCYKFLNNANERFEKKITDFSSEAKNVLMEYSYPGNIRELENIIDQIAILSNDSIVKLTDLPEELFLNDNRIFESEKFHTTSTIYNNNCKSYQVDILNALRESNGNRTLAAKLLGIHRTTLIRNLNKISLPSHMISEKLT